VECECRCRCNVNNNFIECTGIRVSNALRCHLQYCAHRNIVVVVAVFQDLWKSRHFLESTTTLIRQASPVC